MMKFQKLTPVITDNDNIYREAFDFVFTDNDLKNIAVSGAYGAGKSSVFESYMHNCKGNEKYIHISLAHFEQSENCGKGAKDHSEQVDNCGKGTKDKDEESLEMKIINQLIHQIDPSKIKKTSFIARINDNFISQFFKSFGLSYAILLIMIYVFFDKIKLVVSTLSENSIFRFFNFFISSDGLFFMSSILFLLMLFFFIDLINHLRGNNLLKKLSIKDVTIDLADKESESFFDKYLSEIRYLFDNCGSTIVAIEDIDRYYSCSIFEKIRELNTIINYDSKNPIRFFYIIKDDILSSKDRTKFFDFIIPIVPIVNSSNSYSQLRSQLNEGVDGSELDNWFLRGLSIYIDDMRVLKNIINEFLIYRTELVKQELDQNKLLAIITYKNLFPKDFNDLQVGTGYLYALIQSRDAFAEYVIKSDREKLTNLAKNIEEIKKEHLESIDEIGTLYLQPTSNMEIVGGRRVDTYDSQLSLFIEMKKNPTGVFSPGHNPLDQSSKMSDLKNDVNFIKRKEILNVKLKNGIDSLEDEKSIIESHIKTILESHLISNLIDITNIDYFLDLPLRNNPDTYKEITDDLHFQIVPFLIRYGMIDGNYKDYLTYFYDNELKIQDQTFIRSVFDEKPLSINHLLTNPQTVLQVLGGVLENNPAFLNISLFFYIFDNDKKDECAKFIKLSKKCKNHELITRYLKEGKQIKLLIKTLNSLWDSFYIDAKVPTKWSQEDQNRFLQMELIHEDPDVLQKIKIRDDIRTDIENDKDIFDIVSEENRTTIIENLITIGVKFQDVNSLINSGPFLADIYKNDLYIVSVPNVRFWLSTIYNQKEPVEDGLLLSTVLSQPKEPLSIYAINHLDDLIADIISNNSTIKFTDNQDAITIVLNSRTASFETKNKYIDRLKLIIKDVAKIKEIDVIKLLLKNNLVKFSTNNLLGIFLIFKKSFTPEFIAYLSKHEKYWVEDSQINTTLYPEELVNEFFDLVLTETSLNITNTMILLNATKVKIQNQSTIVDEEKAKALISSMALVMNDSNLTYFRTNHPKLVLRFEKNNLESFKAILDSEKTTDPQEIVDLLESDLNGIDQISLLSHVSICIPYKKSYRYPGVKKYIINRLLETEDIMNLIADPMTQAEPLLLTSTTAIAENVKYIIQKLVALPYAFFERLKKNKSISQIDLLELFSNSLDLYTPEAIRQNIHDLHISPFDEMFNGKRPKFESNPMSQRILSSLEKHKMAKLAKNGRLYPKG